jgi:hypothetical protein
MLETPTIQLETDAGSPWLPPRLPRTTSAHRVFCFAYAGGSSSM